MKKISTCLWFEKNAEEAVDFYKRVFSGSRVGRTSVYPESAVEVSGQRAGSVMTVELYIDEMKIEVLNAGPLFKFNPSMSFFVNCESNDEAQEKWKELSEGGKVRMKLDKYPWSELYGWTTDKFGVEWQIIVDPGKEKLTNSFLFVDDLFGRGEEAVKFYTSIFQDGRIEEMMKDDKTNTIAWCSFRLNGQRFVLMEGQGNHGHEFNNSTSLVVNCRNQQEIDYYWEKLKDQGQVEECGWLKDKFGVSWQVVPEFIGEIMANPNKANLAFKEMLQMKKLDLKTFENYL